MNVAVKNSVQWLLVVVINYNYRVVNKGETFCSKCLSGFKCKKSENWAKKGEINPI
jgi:hypothetical protein